MRSLLLTIGKAKGILKHGTYNFSADDKDLSSALIECDLLKKNFRRILAAVLVNRSLSPELV
jgi:hypothetical protein